MENINKKPAIQKSQKLQILEAKLRKMVREELMKEASDPTADGIINSFKDWLITVSKPGHHPRAIAAIVSTFIRTEYGIK